MHRDIDDINTFYPGKSRSLFHLLDKFRYLFLAALHDDFDRRVRTISDITHHSKPVACVLNKVAEANSLHPAMHDHMFCPDCHLLNLTHLGRGWQKK